MQPILQIVNGRLLNARPDPEPLKLAAKDIHSVRDVFFSLFSVSGSLLHLFSFGDGIDKEWMEPMALVSKSAQACNIPEVLVLQGQSQNPRALPLVL